MHRTPITKSSEIASVGYDETDHVLEVEFSRGGVYQYRPSGRHPNGVPPDLAQGMLTADSVGSYFAQNIKNAGFACVKWNHLENRWDAIERRKASAAQVDFMRKLAKKAHWYGGSAVERIGPAWRPLLHHLGRDADLDAMPLVDTWLTSLFQDEAGKALDWFKANVP